MLERYFRPAYQWLLVDPILKFLSKYYFITPNLVTLLGLVFGMMAGAVIFLSPILAAVLLLISGYFDTLDGSLARAKNTMSKQGAVLDIVCDRIVEISVLLGLFSVDPVQRAWPCLLMLSSIFLCLTTFLVVGIFAENNNDDDGSDVANKKSFHYSRGLIERPEAFVFFFLLIIFPSFFIYLSSIFSVLVFYTAIKRLKDFFNKP